MKFGFLKKKKIISVVALVLVFAVFVTLFPASFWTEAYSGFRVDPETGAVIDADTEQPISYSDWQNLFGPLMSVAPENATFTYANCSLDSLSVDEISALVSGSYQAKKYKPKLTFKTLNNNKFTQGSMTLLPSTVLTTYSGGNQDTLEFERQLGNSPISTVDELFSLLTGTVQVDITKNGESSSFQYRLSTDTALLSLVDSGLVNNWSDVLFYKAADVSASVSPKISSATQENGAVTLTADVSSSAPAGICYLWQQVAVNSDGSIPDSGWTDTDMTEQAPVLQANTDTIKYAYRVLAFPDAAARTAFENGTPCLYTVSGPVTLMNDADRAVLFPDILEEGVTWAQVQYLLANANFPGTFTITPDYVLDENTDYLTLSQLASLAAGTIPATAGKIAGYSITFTIDTDNQHKFSSCYLYSGEFGDESTLLGSVTSNKADKKQCSVTLNSNTSGLTAAQLFDILTTGSVYAVLTDANGELQSKAFPYNITADAQLQDLLGAGLVAGWSDLYFYRAAQGTASVDPELIYSSEFGTTAGLLMDCPLDPDGDVYQYVWERAPIGADGSMPDDTAAWESIGAATKDTSVIADLNSILYAYRAVVLPNVTAKTNYLAQLPTLCLKSNVVTLVSEEKRAMVYPAAFAEGFTWEDLQYLLSDNTMIADVYYYSSVFGNSPQPQLAGTETLTGKETENGTVHYVSPDEMRVTLKIGVGGADSYAWERSSDGVSWSQIAVTEVPEYDMQMDAGTAGFTYRCIASKAGVEPFTSADCTFEPIAGCVWGGSQPGDAGSATYYGYLPATGNSAANHNDFGDTYADHNNRGQYAFAPAQNPNITPYESDASEAGMDKWVPEEAGKEGNANVNREYTIHLKADFADLKEPDPVVYLITSDMDYATSDIGYARNWDPTIYNIGTGTEIKGALNSFANLVTSDYSGSFIGFSYTGHSNLPGNNYLFSFPYFTDNNTAANSAFSTLHTYGVCGNGHWDSGFSQISTCFSEINRSVVETYLFGDDQNRLKSIKRVAISIAGSNENGYGGNSKTLKNLFGNNYVSGQDLWYGILTTDGTGQHWLKNSQGAMGQLFTGCVTQSSIYSALASIHRAVYNPCLFDVTLHDIVRAEFEVTAPSGASVDISNGQRTTTWTDGDGDVYTAVCRVDGNGNKLKNSATEVTVRHTANYYYRTAGAFEKTIAIRACEDYIGSNDVFTNQDPAYLTYTNALGEEKTVSVDESKKPTVNVPIKLMDPSAIENWILKGDATDLDALGEEFLQSVYDYVYSYEQVHGTLDLTWMKNSGLIAQSESVRLDRSQSPRPFPETDTTENPLANIHDTTEFEGIMDFVPDEATNGKTSVYVNDGEEFADVHLTVIPVTPVFAPQNDAVWLGEPLRAHNEIGWQVTTVAQRFSPALPAAIPDITAEALSRLQTRIGEDGYLNRLGFTLCDSTWVQQSSDTVTGDTVVGDLGDSGYAEYYLAVSALLNNEAIPLYDGEHAQEGYPVYTIYQAKPDFQVWSFTMGLTKDETATAIPIVRSGQTGLVSSTVPAAAPSWASEQPALWNMLNNSFLAYQSRFLYTFTETTEENPTVSGLYADETLATDGTNLLLTEQHAHEADHPITPDIEVRLAEDAEPFTVLNPNLYVVGCKLTLAKNCVNYIGEVWDPDWRFPMDVTGPGLNGFTAILAPNSHVTIGDLPAGTYTARENADWIASLGTGDDRWSQTAWFNYSGNPSADLSIRLRPQNSTSNWVTTPVYRDDNQMAAVDTTRNSKTLTITNYYTASDYNTYLEEQVTNIYQNDSWRRK